MDVWIGASVTLNWEQKGHFFECVLSWPREKKILLVKFIIMKEKIIFFFPSACPPPQTTPKPFQKTSTGGRDAPLFGYMEITPAPNPSQCARRATVVQILYLSYYWGGWGCVEIRAFSRPLCWIRGQGLCMGRLLLASLHICMCIENEK